MTQKQKLPLRLSSTTELWLYVVINDDWRPAACFASLASFSWKQMNIEYGSNVRQWLLTGIEEREVWTWKWGCAWIVADIHIATRQEFLQRFSYVHAESGVLILHGLSNSTLIITYRIWLYLHITLTGIWDMDHPFFLTVKTVLFFSLYLQFSTMYRQIASLNNPLLVDYNTFFYYPFILIFTIRCYSSSPNYIYNNLSIVQ